MNVKDAVRRLWQRQPGLTVKELMEQLHYDIPSALPLPSYNYGAVKAAKVAIEYQRLPDNPSADAADEADATIILSDLDFDEALVQQKLDQRSAFRAAKNRDQANRLTSELDSLGIAMDDHYRTWRRVRPVQAIAIALPDDSQPEETTFVHEVEPTATATATGSFRVPCSMCGRLFRSRNAVFKHLRNEKSECGASIVIMTGQPLALLPPSCNGKNATSRLSSTGTNAYEQQPVTQTPTFGASRRQRHSTKTGGTARHANADASLWIGDLPLPWTRRAKKYKRLRALLFAYSPPGVHPQPWIKHVVRKAYHGKAVLATTTTQNQEQQLPVYLGYAIVVYRDALEAETVRAALHGKRISPSDVFPAEESPSGNKCADRGTAAVYETAVSFVLTVRPVKRGDTVAAKLPDDWQRLQQDKLHDDGEEHERNGGAHEMNGSVIMPPPGLDPPLADQLRPLAAHELCRRIEQLRNRAVETNMNDNCVHFGNEESPSNIPKHIRTDAELVELAVAAYHAVGPRRQVRHHGRPVPSDLSERLLKLLQALRWPARNQREGLSAERYLVLATTYSSSEIAAKKDPFYSELRTACAELMQFTDPDYYYSAIAVTKNFIASPHTDDRDQSFQYAIALGTFTEGGELCVEGIDDQDDFVCVVVTHNKIAKVEGRHVHWVRTWKGGDRYSLIFYNTSDRQPMPVLLGGLDPAFSST
jgi:hypothetical protein